MLIRKTLHISFMALAIAGLAFPAQSETANSYPSGPVRLIVPYPPGGLIDTLARHFAKAVSPALEQPVVIENRLGVGGRLAASLVVHARPMV